MKHLYTKNYDAVRHVIELLYKNRYDSINTILSGAFGMSEGHFVALKNNGSRIRIYSDGATAGLAMSHYGGRSWCFAGKDLPLTRILHNEFNRLAVVYWVASQQSWKDLAEGFVPYLIASVFDGGDAEITAKRRRTDD
jgi:hypothetical protein